MSERVERLAEIRRCLVACDADPFAPYGRNSGDSLPDTRWLAAELEALEKRYDAVRHAYAVEAQERGRLENLIQDVAAVLRGVAA